MFYENAKTEKMTLSKDTTTAVLVSLTMHCVILFSCSLVLGQAASYDNDRPIMVSLALPFPSGEGGTLSPASAAAKKAASLKEVKKSAAEPANLIRKERVEPFFAKMGEEKAAQPQENDHGSQNVHAVDPTIYSLGQKAEVESASATDGMLYYTTAKGSSVGGETASSGNAQENADSGGATFPAYAKGNASAGSGVIFAAPRYGENPLPAYPQLAKERGYQGTVVLEVLVTKEGSAGKVSVFQSSRYSLLDEAAVSSVKKWRFEPGKRGDKKVDMWVNIPIRFQLELKE